MKRNIGIFTLIVSLLFTSISYSNEVNVFSARHYDSDIQLYEKFTAKTGINVNVVSGKSKALEKRMIEEGKDLATFICTLGKFRYKSTLKKNKIHMTHFIGVAIA